MNPSDQPFRAFDGSYFATARDRRLWNLWLATVALIIVGSLVAWLLIVRMPAASAHPARTFWVPPSRASTFATPQTGPSETVATSSRQARYASLEPPPAGPGIVWVNTRSKIYHYPGYAWYGTTRAGKYLRELDAVAEGDRAALNERRPATFYATPRP